MWLPSLKHCENLWLLWGQLKAELYNIRGWVWLFSVLLHASYLSQTLSHSLQEHLPFIYFTPLYFFPPFYALTNSSQASVRFSVNRERSRPRSTCIWTGRRLSYNPMEWHYLQLNFQKIFWPESSLNANYIADHLGVQTALEMAYRGIGTDKAGSWKWPWGRAWDRSWAPASRKSCD